MPPVSDQVSVVCDGLDGAFRDFDLTETVELGGHVWEFTGGVLGSGAFGVVLDARNASFEGRAANFDFRTGRFSS